MYKDENKSRVLHLITGLGQGGAERQLVCLAQANPKHAVCTLADGGTFADELKELGLPVFTLNMKNKIITPKDLYVFRSIIKKYRPNIIHAWMYHSCLFSGLYKLLFGRDIPLIWGIRCSNMDTKRYSNKLKLVIKICKILSRVPNALIFNSEAGKSFHDQIGFRNNKTKVIYNGIDTNKFKSDKEERNFIRNQYSIPKKNMVLINVARVDPMKNHRGLLKVFSEVSKQYSKTSLILAGKGTKELKLPSGVIALGEHKQIEKIYRVGDLVISNSIFGEGFSNALGEGMSSSLVPITTDVGDSKKIIGEIGKLIQPNNNEELVEAIMAILNLKRKELNILKRRSRERVFNKFNLPLMISSYEKLYKLCNEN